MAGPEIWDVALIPPPTLVRNGLKPLARCVLIPLGLTAVTAATDAAIRKKNFRSAIHPQTQTKYLKQNREIQQQWTGHEKFDIYFLMFFHSLCQSFISGRGTGHWALGYVSTQTWDFPNISLFPKILSLKSFGNSWGNSCTKFAILQSFS